MDAFDQDIQLMLRFQRGDLGCFEQIVERHKQRVFNIAYRYTGNTHDAEDVAQQVFINIYNARNAYSPKAQFTTWLYTICKNTCLKTFRKKRLTTISIESELSHANDAHVYQLPDTRTPTPLENQISAEQDSKVKEAINSLPDNQKLIVILFKYEQLSYEKISEITGLSIQAVKSLLHRARLNLKEKLSSYLNR